KTVNILKDKTETLAITPPLAAGYALGSLTAEKTSTVNVKVTNDGKEVYNESLPTKLFPRDQLPLAQNLAFSGPWVTPQSPVVEELLTSAKKRHPSGKLAGSFEPTMPQMKALFEELKARGMSYVLVTDFGAGTAQHARLPADTIRSTNALCLD